ncbi:MAG TPA: protein kinase [Ktedonobacteraceae bacterium]|jgi:serine/threonine protein kinase|nr:protein kinase [Ktedonobacteraceae bacterium]
MVKNLTFGRLVGTNLGKYRLEQLIEQDNSELVFLARTTDAQASYLIRILAEPAGLLPRDHGGYLERFLYRAREIAALQHPYILPIVDYGVERGTPYLVSPQIPMRSLRARLAKSGPLDIHTAGRYLDQVAATLEYAHQHNVLHGNLSIDNIFIRLDGQLVVANFGIMDLIELSGQDAQQHLLHGRGEVCAPEQLLGKTISAYTDVYALGAVLYHLLTGSPVFAGNTPEELAQQHLYASVPPLSRWRPDLPSGLYSIVARALAKDPAQRFHQPGALANAYQRIVDPQTRTRVPFVVSSSPDDSFQHSHASVISLPDVQAAEIDKSGNSLTRDEHTAGTPQPVLQKPFSQANPFYSDPDSLIDFNTPRLSLMRRFQRKNNRRLVIISAAILVVLVAGIIAGTLLLTQKGVATAGLSGQVAFLGANTITLGESNALSIVVHGLSAPPSGYEYDAWFINSQSEQVLALGTLTLHQQTYSVTYSAGTTNLLADGNKLEVTLEQKGVKLPVGKVELAASFPPHAFTHIQHLLVSFPVTPGKIGVLVGSLLQTHLLNIQANVLQNFAYSRDTPAIQCEAQSILDIIEGAKGNDYRTLSPACTQQDVTQQGDGFGLLGSGGYFSDSAVHAALAIGQPDATSSMRQHAALMAIALSNVKGWVNTIEQDAQRLRTNPADLSKIPEIVALAGAAYYGVDANGDGVISPVPGEAGVLAAYVQGQLMATLSLAPGN